MAPQVTEHMKKVEPVLAVLDAGCGPNLIARDSSSDEILRKIKRDRELMNLVDANGNPLNLMGTIQLYLRMATYRTKVTFVGTRKLSADIILGCEFLDKLTDAVSASAKQLILKDETQVDIRRRPSGTIDFDEHPPDTGKPKKADSLEKNKSSKRYKLITTVRNCYSS